MKRTNVVIDEELLEEAVRISRERTYSRTIERALTDLVRRAKARSHDERAFQIARAAMLALPCVELPITLPIIESAVDVYRRARRAGVTVRSSVDCLVGVKFALSKGPSSCADLVDPC